MKLKTAKPSHGRSIMGFLAGPASSPIAPLQSVSELRTALLPFSSGCPACLPLFFYSQPPHTISFQVGRMK